MNLANYLNERNPDCEKNWQIDCQLFGKQSPFLLVFVLPSSNNFINNSLSLYRGVNLGEKIPLQ